MRIIDRELRQLADIAKRYYGLIYLDGGRSAEQLEALAWLLGSGYVVDLNFQTWRLTRAGRAALALIAAGGTVEDIYKEAQT